ncbi:pseudouridylate synthase TRUB1-like [Oratosquilla oratoria]|uniref:pseudouridylate synthase TRUB1-like n=1 Tax=Oratosquilla oratoria TaxID=337810 RepID=UPI003F7781E8
MENHDTIQSERVLSSNAIEKRHTASIVSISRDTNPLAGIRYMVPCNYTFIFIQYYKYNTLDMCPLNSSATISRCPHRGNNIRNREQTNTRHSHSTIKALYLLNADDTSGMTQWDDTVGTLGLGGGLRADCFHLEKSQASWPNPSFLTSVPKQFSFFSLPSPPGDKVTGDHSDHRQTIEDLIKEVRKVANLPFKGIFAVQKPKGITSAQVLEEIKDNIRKELKYGSNEHIKLGHGGTLDSSATGVLVVGAGQDCWKLKSLLTSEKCYKVSGVLGKSTDTYNDIGTVCEEKPYDHVTKASVEEALKGFSGSILQLPPVYSALKKEGKRYSDLARMGEHVQREARPVTCYNLCLVGWKPPLMYLTVHCGAGFYVRSLIHDLGQALGTCAHVQDLERTQQGPFTMRHSLPLQKCTLSNVVNNIRNNHKRFTAFHKSCLRNRKFDKW